MSYCIGHHGVQALAVMEVYLNGSTLGYFCEDHALQFNEDPNAAFRTL